MNKAPLKVSLPSEIAVAFCATLKENDIKYVPDLKGSIEKRSGYDFVVNSAEEVKQILILVLKSEYFWTTVAGAILAFTRRHKHKSIIVEKDGFKFKATGMSQAELSKSLEGATKLILTTKENEADK
ncbi:hypothetical protein [Winslowiella toletana]|uniref:hypothetical protein n=1 Tax=Winslowiella toletana TaxID=92490 RepID=UPI0028BDB48C|nr:hypothetical protein [Winslowiella toletana]WNN45462.1 hypothetical protein RIN69_06075 [Winslowiella toletana]